MQNLPETVATLATDGLQRELSDVDMQALRRAVAVLERPGWVGRLSGLVGGPVATLGAVVPASVADAASRATHAALHRAARMALRTVPARTFPGADGLNKVLAATSGAIGGALGFSTLVVELPVSTAIMLRAIATIAQREGEDLADPETALACIEVFALGGGGPADHHEQNGYLAVRAAMARSIAEAVRYVAERGVLEETAPVLVRFLAKVAARFGVVVSQKVAAQSVPVIGALGGAAVNTAFISHFQAIAGGHFVVRRLERTYGEERVHRLYEEIAREQGHRA